MQSGDHDSRKRVPWGKRDARHLGRRNDPRRRRRLPAIACCRPLPPRRAGWSSRSASWSSSSPARPCCGAATSQFTACSRSARRSLRCAPSLATDARSKSPRSAVKAPSAASSAAARPRHSRAPSCWSAARRFACRWIRSRKPSAARASSPTSSAATPTICCPRSCSRSRAAPSIRSTSARRAGCSTPRTAPATGSS